MATDLYNGQFATNPKDAKRLMNSVKPLDANEKYASALKFITTPGRKLATIGWSFGGSQALHATLSAPDLISATVSYYPYGEMESDKKLLAPMKGRILIQVGGTKKAKDWVAKNAGNTGASAPDVSAGDVIVHLK